MLNKYWSLIQFVELVFASLRVSNMCSTSVGVLNIVGRGYVTLPLKTDNLWHMFLRTWKHAILFYLQEYLARCLDLLIPCFSQ